MEEEFSFSSTPDARWTDPSLDPDYRWTESSSDAVAEPTTTPEEQALIDLIHWYSYSVFANIFVTIGIVGNILSILVLSRPKLKGVMYVYLLGLAVTNLCVLVSALPALIALGKGRKTRFYAVAFYEAHLALPTLNSFMAASIYIMICMTVNRYVAIYLPMYYKTINTYKNAYMAIACSFVGGVLIHIALFFDHNVKETACNEYQTNMTASNETCVIYESVENEEMTQTIWYKVYIGGSETVLRLGPITVLCYLNSWIIVGLLRLSKNRQVLRGTATQRRSNGGQTEPRASSTMLPPPAAVLAARANGHGNGNGTMNGYLPTNNCTTSLLAGNEENDYNKSITFSAVNGRIDKPDPSIAPNGSISMETGGAPESAPGSCDPSVNGSGNSSRRETPPQNQSFHNLLVTTRPRTSSNGSKAVLNATMSRSTPNRASTRRGGMHNPEERVMVNVLAAVIIQFVICTFPAAILSIIYMNKSSYDQVSFSIFRAFANNMELLGFTLNFFIYCFCSTDIRRAFFESTKETFRFFSKHCTPSLKGCPPQVRVDLELVEIGGQDEGGNLRLGQSGINPNGQISSTPNGSTCVVNNQNNHNNELNVSANFLGNNNSHYNNDNTAVTTYFAEDGRPVSAACV